MEAYRLSDLGVFMDSYYLNPKPELISDAISLLGSIEVRTNSIPPYIGFFNKVFNDTDKYRSQWIEQIEKQNEIVKKILTFSMNTKPSVILSKMKVSPSYNDYCWGSFYASGDNQYLEIILDNTKYCSETKNINMFFTGWTAKWSLCSNAKSHKKIKEYLLKKLSESKDINIEQILNQDPGTVRAETINKIKEYKQSGIWDDELLNNYSAETNNVIENIFAVQ
jgi:hypothetical protein